MRKLLAILAIVFMLPLAAASAHAERRCQFVPSPPTIVDAQPAPFVAYGVTYEVGYKITVNLPTDGSFNNDPNTGVVAIYRYEPTLHEYVANLGVFLSGGGTSVTAVLPGPFTVFSGDLLAARVGDVKAIDPNGSGADQAWSSLSDTFVVP